MSGPKGNATGEGGAGTSRKTQVNYITLETWTCLALTVPWLFVAFVFGDLVLHYLEWLS